MKHKWVVKVGDEIFGESMTFDMFDFSDDGIDTSVEACNQRSLFTKKAFEKYQMHQVEIDLVEVS